VSYFFVATMLQKLVNSEFPNNIPVAAMLSHFWKIDVSIQGWKKSLYLTPEEFFAPPAE
jgi:hypothetical protein